MSKRFAIAALTWTLLVGVIVVPIAVAALSPLQVGRDAIYIAGAMGGIICLALMLVQPLLVAGLLPGFLLLQQRRWHRYTGTAILFALCVHIAGLYLTSPDDMTDALLLVAPTPFSVYGVIGLWGLLFTALVAFTRSRLWLNQQTWQLLHSSLAVVVVVSSVVHALMIEGVMGNASKIVLSVSVLLATAFVIYKLQLRKPTA